MKGFFNLMILAVLLLLLAEAQFSSAACNVQQLTPCLSALTSNTKPSQLCCQRLNQQKPCFCEYLKNPNLKAYVNSPAAKKAIKTCKVSIPKC
nr:non-specific lipid-transfer protein 2-like [Ipomoea batatas]GMD57806.1 non-specific lipid-transfer protein 2-like [Ipomoea batatas]GME03018.1 non-specific lipid-transfer protein 2-like [Ipomoea batatas]